ncbi:hypothetical protein D3C78_1834250 [compost metagenome]
MAGEGLRQRQVFQVEIGRPDRRRRVVAGKQANGEIRVGFDITGEIFRFELRVLERIDGFECRKLGHGIGRT